jgi:hypothetical protein
MMPRVTNLGLTDLHNSIIPSLSMLQFSKLNLIYTVPTQLVHEEEFEPLFLSPFSIENCLLHRE